MSGFGDRPAGIPSKIPAEQYHRDELGDTPTLSASIARVLLTASPKHAWTQHPRLNPDFTRDDEDKFSLGTIVHSLLLEGVDIAHICHYPDWRTAAAKEDRDQARAHGRIPILAKDWDRVQAMLSAVAPQLERFDIDPVPFTAGEPEVCLTWEMDGVWCRALIDWLHDGGLAVSDYKSTSASAHPASWPKTALGFGADLQVAIHSAGVEAVYGQPPVWRYVVQETYPPYALSVITPSPEMLALGRDKMRAALAKWRECLFSGVWPGYPATVERAELPPWEMAKWMESDAAEEVTVG